MKQPLRYFSIGLLTASVILFVFYQFLGQKELTEEESVDEMIASIEADGYRVISESEYISLSVTKHEDDRKQSDVEDNDKSKKEDKEKTKDKKPDKDEDKKEDKSSTKKEEKEDKKEKQVESYTLTIKENMMPSTISELLAENKIIKDAAKFSKFLEDEGYSPKVQIGKHKLNSDMNHREIAEELIKFK